MLTNCEVWYRITLSEVAQLEEIDRLSLRKIEEEAFIDLLKRKEKHKKMENVQHTTFEMQNYLKQNQITPKQARTIFKFRTRMENFSENFKARKPTKQCQVCNESKDMQSHSLKCIGILEIIRIRGNIDEIFNKTISSNMARVLENMIRFREHYVENNNKHL